MTEDPKLSRRYRELPPEEPARHVDEAILARARRAVRARPAPLVVPSGRSRWYFPVAAAAVIVLAVAVTVHMQKEEPAEEVVALRDAPPPPAPAEERKAADVAGAAAKPEASRLRREAASAMLAGSSFAHASPEQWLQGIADLRRQNRDDEADRQLAEFRKRYPDYRISKEMLERLEMPK